MSKSPAMIVQALLTAPSGASVSTPESGGDWPVYIGSMPDGQGVPDNAVAVYDTEGRTFYRLLASGRTVSGFGVQIKVRALAYDEGWELLKELAEALDAVHRQTIEVNAESCKVDTIIQTSPVIALGQDGERRALFTYNALLVPLSDTN